MPKIIVIYDTLTGNTEKMAKAVVEGAKTVRGVEVELLKAGTAFPLISKLESVDAIILGSPSRYGSITADMRTLLTSAKELKEAKKLNLSGKVGGAFGSYAWDGGWVIDKLEMDMKSLGIKIALPVVSVVDRMGAMGVRIQEEDLLKCRELGRIIAEKSANKSEKR